jgi:hypothetical protein
MGFVRQQTERQTERYRKVTERQTTERQDRGHRGASIAV